jgi:hypothetical protein
MKQQLRGISEAVAPLLQSANAWERIEAARTMLALHGILVPESSAHITDPKAQAASRHLREVVVGRIWRHNEIRRRINRRAYLKREIAKLEVSGTNTDRLTALRNELADLLKIRKRVPLSEMPSDEPDSTVGASEPVATAKDAVALQKARENALAYLAGLEKQQNEE